MSDSLSTKDKILIIASTILQNQGYNGFSYSHISKQLGIRNAAIHYHYPTKSDLGNAMIQRYQQQFAQWKLHHCEKYAEQHEKLLEAYLAISRSFINKQRTICPLAVLEVNYSVFPKSMQILTRQLNQDSRAWFTQILTEGKTACIFKFDGSAENKSLLLSAALQGASMMARVDSPEIFEKTVTLIKHDLGLNHVR